MKPSKMKTLSLAFVLCMTIALSACGNNTNTGNTILLPSEILNHASSEPSNEEMPDNHVYPEATPDNTTPLLPREIVIMSKDINDTLTIIIQPDDIHRLTSLSSNEIEKIVIPESDSDGYYEVEFWLTADAILKADTAVSYMSDFPICISIGGGTFEFFMDDNVHHYSRTFSSVSEGLKGFDCPLFEIQITREDFETLFTKITK